MHWNEMIYLLIQNVSSVGETTRRATTICRAKLSCGDGAQGIAPRRGQDAKNPTRIDGGKLGVRCDGFLCLVASAQTGMRKDTKRQSVQRKMKKKFFLHLASWRNGFLAQLFPVTAATSERNATWKRCGCNGLVKNSVQKVALVQVRRLRVGQMRSTDQGSSIVRRRSTASSCADHGRDARATLMRCRIIRHH